VVIRATRRGGLSTLYRRPPRMAFITASATDYIAVGTLAAIDYLGRVGTAVRAELGAAHCSFPVRGVWGNDASLRLRLILSSSHASSFSCNLAAMASNLSLLICDLSTWAWRIDINFTARSYSESATVLSILSVSAWVFLLLDPIDSNLTTPAPIAAPIAAKGPNLDSQSSLI
jgi:hypothetical protein